MTAQNQVRVSKRSRRSLRRFVAGVAVLAVAVATLDARTRARISPDKLLDDIRYLTSVPLGGRADGSAGLKKAAEYISGAFAQAGVKPVPGSSGYMQPFALTVGAAIGSASSLTWSLPFDTQHRLGLHTDYEPFAFSAKTAVTAPVVFAGYGITACELGYDDYANVDVRGKIVIILRHEPQEYEANSPFEGRVYTEHSQTFRKMLTAKAHGAVGVLVVNDTAAHSGPDNLEKFTSLPSPGSVGIPAAGIRSEVVAQWFNSAGHDFADEQTEIDRTLKPVSFEFPGLQVSLHADVAADPRSIANVVGYIPGTTPEYVIVGAHYDHLGNGEQFSLAADHNGAMHPGADDNASGTAAVLNIARWFAAQPPMRRGVLFVTFAGEEVGLLGSTWFTQNPPLPLSNASAMINLDMIGRMREKSLTVGGVDTASGLRALVESAAKDYPFELQTGSQAVYGSSDHTSFTAHGIPALFFFTGLHSDYHRPGDTADKIDRKSTALIVDLVADITAALAETTEKMSFRGRINGGTCTSADFVPHTSAGADR